MKALFLSCLVLFLAGCDAAIRPTVELTLKPSAEGTATKADDLQVTDALKILDAVAPNHGFTQNKASDPRELRRYYYHSDNKYTHIDMSAFLSKDGKKLNFEFFERVANASKESIEAREELTDKLKEKFGAGFVENIR